MIYGDKFDERIDAGDETPLVSSLAPEGDKIVVELHVRHPFLPSPLM